MNKQSNDTRTPLLLHAARLDRAGGVGGGAVSQVLAYAR